jgi:YlmC/YmxH family sporulation protein
MRIYELKQRELVNINDGKRLGFIHDIDFDISTGSIEAIIVLKETKFFSFFKKDNEVTNPWRLIQRIGNDVVLVDFDEEFLPWC